MAKLTDAECSQLAIRIQGDILKEITSRGGWSDEWDQFDDGVRAEIIGEFRSIVHGILATHK